MMAPKRQNVGKKTGTLTRATIYFSPDIHTALRLRAATAGASISQMVNSMVRAALAEEATDMDAFLLHQDEKEQSFESFICGLRRRGRL
jgi:plasmid stability protein